MTAERIDSRRSDKMTFLVVYIKLVLPLDIEENASKQMYIGYTSSRSLHIFCKYRLTASLPNVIAFAASSTFARKYRAIVLDRVCLYHIYI